MVLWPALLLDDASKKLESSSELIFSTPWVTAAAATAAGAAEAEIKSMVLGTGRGTVPKIPAMAFVLDDCGGDLHRGGGGMQVLGV